MQIGKRFNSLTREEYFYYIENHKQCSDFNTLGLFRSIIENEKLPVDEKILVRDFALRYFQKAFDFLQLKDPKTYLAVSTIGIELTKADEEKLWDDVQRNQQRILAEKRIRHRNFGIYSKHLCGHEDCTVNGIMVRQGTELSYTGTGDMRFISDKNKYQARLKSVDRKADRKKEKQLIAKELSDSDRTQQ